jgi:glutamate racemase
MQQTHIGVIDSGVGGLSVYAAIKALNPTVPILYLADSAYIPYGTKSPEFISTRSAQLVHTLVQKEITTIVIACNTITVTCLDTLRVRFPEVTFIGTVPVIKSAAEISPTKHIGVLSTSRTTESDYLDNLIATYAANCIVTSLGTDELVPFVERGTIDGQELKEVVVRVLQPFIAASCDTIVLGCTHFPFLRPMIQSVLGETVFLLDSGEAVAKQLMRQLEKEKLIIGGSDQFLTTGEANSFENVLTKLLHRSFSSEAVEKIDIV